MSLRIGYGIDFHRLAENREFRLGGVLIPHEKGLLGHSDADVLLHAVCDALLGALALGDIGVHFPDTDPAYKNADSRNLLAATFRLIQKEGYEVVNIDSTVCLEKPRIKPHVAEMQQIIAGILEVSERDISIKATTTEKMGFAGREEGVVAHAVALLQKTTPPGF
jgi:2-C-methyl-D-erythritol 2,4-cyclodiphosphate synthase